MKRQSGSLLLPGDVKTVGRVKKSDMTGILREALGFVVVVGLLLVSFTMLAILVDTPYPTPNADGGVTWKK